MFVAGSGPDCSKALNASSIIFEIDLAQFVFFYGGPDKAASVNRLA
jgi:hypothetical protein